MTLVLVMRREEGRPPLSPGVGNLILELTILGCQGVPFMWVRKQNGRIITRERLDRALASVDWRNYFKDATVTNLPRVASDHHPIMISIVDEENVKGGRLFRFEAIWLGHSDFPTIVSNRWSSSHNIRDNLDNVATSLTTWNREVFGNI